MIKVAFDVDGTLLTEGSEPQTPRFEVIQLFLLLQSFGCEVSIWSHAGVIHAKNASDTLGLNARIIEKGAEFVDISIDNQDVKLGKVNIKV